MTPKIASLSFGPWLPDVADYESAGSPNVQNVLWVNGSYAPALGFASLGFALSETCQGAFACTDSSESVHIYFGGPTKLQEFNGDGFTDRSGATYTTQVDEYWKYTQFSTPNFGNLVFATNFADALQQIDPDTDVVFSATPGTPPKASQIATISEFVVLGDTEDGINGHVPYRLQWCALSDPTNWAYGTLAAQEAQAGEQYMNAEYGAVTHISEGLLSGLVFQERCITRMVYVGGDDIFEFQDFEKQRGALFPNACLQLGSLVYFIAHDGFCVTDGGSVTPIGHGKVDTTFLNDVSQAFASEVTVAVDPISKIIEWSYCSSGNTSGVPDKSIAYNYAEGNFTPITQTVTRTFTSKSFGYTMDTLDNVNTDLDLIPESLDNPTWEGGNQQLGALDANNFYGTLTGAALDAVIETPEDRPNDMGQTYVDGARPTVVDSQGDGVITITPLYRDYENKPYTSGIEASQNQTTGICDMGFTAGLVKFQVGITGGFDKAIGLDVFGRKAGRT